MNDYLTEYERLLNINIKDVKKFKINYLNQKDFNIGLMIPEINVEGIKILSNITDVQLISFNNIDLDMPKLKTLSINSLKELVIATRNMNCIISSDIRTINIAKNIGIETFAIVHKYLDNMPTFIHQYINTSNNFEKIIAKIKLDLEKFRLKLKEQYYLGQINQIIHDNSIPYSEKLNIKSSFLFNELFEITQNKKYLEEYIDIQKELQYLPGYELSSQSNIASCYYFFTDKQNEAKKIWEKIYPEIKKQKITHVSQNYATFQYNQKNYEEFFKYYPIILKSNSKHINLISNKINSPLWQGETDISDKTLLVYFELGFGDTIMYSKYLSNVEKLFKKVIFVTSSQTKDIFKDSFPNIKTYSEEEFLNLDLKYDFYIPLISIQVVLKLNPDKQKIKKWILPNKEKVKEFKKYFSKDKFNIGIFWDSTKTKYNRFIPLENILPIAYLNNVKLYSLHLDKSDAEINYLDDNVEIINLGKHFKDFSDTAAAIENCDLIISADSSVMNLAGAMGKKTFAIFNKYPEARWNKLDGDDIGWYKSVKPFKAEVENDFKPVIDKICDEIKPLVHQKKFKERR